MNAVEENRKTFERIWNDIVKRPGQDEMLSWLTWNDFFTAPASTRYHGAYPGGLAEHSLHVYERMLAKARDYDLETVTIISLLHDVCKVNMYKENRRKEPGKLRTGEGESAGQEAPYRHEDHFAIGHGEKSVILIQRHMRLTDEEIVAINWHMGGFDARARQMSRELSRAWEEYPLAFLLHIADMEATWIDERRDRCL